MMNTTLVYILHSLHIIQIQFNQTIIYILHSQSINMHSANIHSIVIQTSINEIVHTQINSG